MAETQLTLGDRGEIMRGSVTVAQMVVTNSSHSRMVQDRALFLAAPELLLAAVFLLDQTDYFINTLWGGEIPDTDADELAGYEAARAAIARATGAAS